MLAGWMVEPMKITRLCACQWRARVCVSIRKFASIHNLAREWMDECR